MVTQDDRPDRLAHVSNMSSGNSHSPVGWTVARLDAWARQVAECSSGGQSPVVELVHVIRRI